MMKLVLVWNGINLILDYLNDLWRYSVSDNSFTWMYGTASKTANFVSPAPGGLSKHSMVLANDNLYVFGGSGYDDAGTLGSDTGCLLIVRLF